MALGEEIIGTGVAGSIAAVGFTTALIIGIGIYVYTALAWMTIAKKLIHKYPWLAWIPIANLFLIAMLAKKKWTWGFIFLVPIVNLVFGIIWVWNIFVQRKYPGWLALLPILGIIPFIGWIATIGFFVVIGLVAWKDR